METRRKRYAVSGVGDVLVVFFIRLVIPGTRVFKSGNSGS